MSISFAGQDLLLEDPEGKFSAWLDWAMDYEGYRPFAQPVYRLEERSSSRAEDGLAFVGLPIPNYPEPPKLRLNSLYVPTGAGRWSQGLFLVNKVGLALVNENLESDGGGRLVISEGVLQFTFRMYPLAPRLVSERNDQGDEIYLLPLVDRRWSWQWRDAGDFELDDESTWEELIEQLDSQGTHEITLPTFGGIPGAYVRPNPVELTRRYENYAMMLDAVAACLGMRVTFYPWYGQEQLFFESVAGALGVLTQMESLTTPALLGTSVDTDRQISKAPTRNEVPAQLQVCFPKTNDGIQTETGELYVVTLSASDYLTEDTNQGTQEDGTYQTFFDSAEAEYRDGYEPENRQELQSLAEQIARDYYGWLQRRYDIAYNGLAAWLPCGFDDYVLYEIGTINQQRGRLPGIADSDYNAITRIRSLPYNFGFRELLHATGDVVSSSSTSSSSSSTVEDTSSSSSSSLSSWTNTESSSSTGQKSSSSSSSQSVTESSSSGDAVIRLVQDVCCNDEGDIDVCYTLLHLKWVPQHGIYGITWWEEEECSCS